MEGATEYLDSWRGLRISVPQGWQVRRSGWGIFLYDVEGRQAVVVQPRPNAAGEEALEQALRHWLMRCDPQATLQAEPEGRGGARFYTVALHTPSGEEAAGVFALQADQGSGLISGFIGPAAGYDAASRTATEALATLRALPAHERRLWHEPSQQACTALLPEGWRAEATVNRPHPAAPATVELKAWAGDAAWVVASADGKFFVEPGLLSGLIGSLAGGIIGRGKLVDAAGFAKVHLLPGLGAGARVEMVTPRPDLILAVAAQEGSTGGLGAGDVLAGKPTAADVVFSFEADGRPMRHVARVLTMHVPQVSAHKLPLWMVMVPLSYSAPASEAERLAPLLEGVGLSFRANREWRGREQARLEAMIGRRMSPARATEGGGVGLAELEAKVGELVGKPLAIHERRFVDSRIEADGESGPAATAPLLDRAVWQA